MQDTGRGLTRSSLPLRTGANVCGLLGVVFACSTLAPEPKLTCESNEDCGPDEVCLLEFGPACYPENQVAPLADLAFVVCEPQPNSGDEFCSELRGCDNEFKFKPEEDPKRPPNELELRRNRLSDNLALRFETTSQDAPGTDPVLQPAGLALTQPSRLQRAVAKTEVQFSLPEEPPPEGDPPQSVTLGWPYYHPQDSSQPLISSLRAVIVEVTPKAPSEDDPDAGEAPALAPYFRMLLRPSARQETPCTSDDDCGNYPGLCIDLDEGGQCATTPGSNWTFPIAAINECHRTLRGKVVTVQEDTLIGENGIKIDLTYAQDPAAPVWLPPLPPSGFVGLSIPCSSDADCLDGQLCNTNTEQCVLDLRGRKAARTVTVQEGEDGWFELLAYTYCEEGAVPSRTFTISTTGAATAGFPDVGYTFEQSFPTDPGDDLAPVEPPGKVCLPDWDPAQQVTIEIVGDPVTLLGEGDTRWTCCSTTCLPTSAEEETDPVQETDCFGAAGSGSPLGLQLEASLLMEDVEGWDALGCLPLAPKDAEAGVAATMLTTPSCAEIPCTFELGPGPRDGQLTYRLRVEAPQGSVLESTVFDALQVVDKKLGPIRLQQRPIIRGVVRLPESLCDSDAGDCGAERAVVMAERLRMPDDDPDDVLAPYFYSTETFFDPITQSQGAFVLPVNRGVYVFTVLPAGVRSGGPAPFEIIDLRDKPEQELDVTLDLGVTVSMSMDGFDRDASVAPLDVGTWSNIDHPAGGDRKLDLNDPDECYFAGGAQGCQIRALIPPERRLFLNQVDETGFIARKGSADCGS